MNKQDLVKAMVKRMPDGTTQKLVESAVNAFIDSVTEALANEEEVVLTGFGSFKVTKRDSRTGRNPQTGETMTIPATFTPVFRPGKNLKEAVNNKWCDKNHYYSQPYQISHKCLIGFFI